MMGQYLTVHIGVNSIWLRGNIPIFDMTSLSFMNHSKPHFIRTQLGIITMKSRLIWRIHNGAILAFTLLSGMLLIPVRIQIWRVSTLPVDETSLLGLVFLSMFLFRLLFKEKNRIGKKIFGIEFCVKSVSLTFHLFSPNSRDSLQSYG